MAQENHCPQCGANLPPDAPEGLCPKCLMKAVQPSYGNDVNATLEQSHLIEGPGTKIGRYELLSLIGEGGMGLVYQAEQKEPVKRRVALKIIKPGMDTKQVVTRFEAERQTLAILEHPNIAHVFDAGTTETGRPYFVMEYVEGRSITKYCDQQKLSIEQRLELFQEVCEGVHHAHQKGIIHRDIKPSNVLVSVQNDKAIPKIIDFGIAKAITQPLSGETAYTEQGQLLGTPEYMSPEQAEMAYQDVDTRSDIYSLGVLLYELLAGVPPFDAKRLREGGIEHIQQVICEEQPRTPSARLTSLGDKAKAVAERRRTQIITLTRRLHRELEWIPMKAMRKDRTRRYRSASELADDIQNYINGTPLIAGPESTMYRARKFVRRHAGSVATVALVTLVVVLGLVTSIIMGCRAERARRQEASARKQVEQALVRAEKAEKAAQEQSKIAEEQRTLAEERAEEYRRSLYYNRIALSEIAYRDGNIQRLRKLLDSCPKDLRAWEWDYLNYISDQSSKTIQGHYAWELGISPDGKRIAASDSNNAIKIWDASSGVELRTLLGHNKRVINSTFSPDGKLIVSGAYDGIIRVWDVNSGEEIMTLKGHKDRAGAYFSPDGTRIISGSMDNTIIVWDAVTGNELTTWNTHDEQSRCHAISPDGKYIVSGGDSSVLRLWDATTGAELKVFRGHNDGIRSVAFSPDGKHIISGGFDSTIKVWDAGTGEELKTLHGHKDTIYSVAYDSRGERIASGSRDGTIKLWDTETGSELMTLSGHLDYVSSVAFSPHGERIFSTGQDGMIKVWDLSQDYIDPVILEGYQSIAFSPDGTKFVTSGENITIWDAVNVNELMKMNAVGGLASYSPDGKYIISTDSQIGAKRIKIWDAITGKDLLTLSGHEATIWSLSYSPDGTRIASGSVDKTIRIWDASTGVEIRTLRGHGDWPDYPEISPVTSVAFSPDGKLVASCSYDYTVRIWNPETGTEMKTLKGHSYIVNDVAFSPDGKRIGSASSDGTFRIWNVATGSELMAVKAHEGEVISIAFSPDGKRIVTGSKDKTIRIWDAETGLEIIMLRIGGEVWGLSFSPDGKTLATTSKITRTSGHTVTIWKSAASAGPRRTRADASMLVDKLYEEHGSYSQVIDKLKADETLEESDRKLALQIANTRLSDLAEKLRSESVQVIIFPGRDIEEFRVALEKVEKAKELRPDDPLIKATLGIAQYRVGAYEDALETLRSCKSIGYLDRAVAAFTAMALHQLGRQEEAEASLERLRDLCKDEEGAQFFLSEPERLINGKNGGRR